MPETPSIDRRKFIAGAAGAAALLGGCDRLAQSDTTKNVLASAETLTSDVQHLISPEQVLAPEYTKADLSRYFKPNGTADPDNDDYQEMAAKGFVDWTLERGPGRAAGEIFARGVARAAATDANYPARLRRGLELHWEVEGRVTWRVALARGFAGARAI
jgi:hypothetical protein